MTKMNKDKIEELKKNLRELNDLLFGGENTKK